MKLELGKFEIKDIQFADKSYVENHVLYVNKEEVEALVLEDDKLIGCHLEIAKPGEATRITPVKDVIEPRVKVSGGEIFPGIIGKVSPQVGSGRTHALDGCCVVTVGRIVGFQEGVIDMSGPAAEYCPFSKTYNLCVVIEPKDGLETHVYEKAGRMAGLKVATYLGELVRNLEPDVIETYETKPVFEQAAQYPDLPKIGYIHMLQSQGLLHDTYYYGVDAKQIVPTFMEQSYLVTVWLHVIKLQHIIISTIRLLMNATNIMEKTLTLWELSLQMRMYSLLIKRDIPIWLQNSVNGCS